LNKLKVTWSGREDSNLRLLAPQAHQKNTQTFKSGEGKWHVTVNAAMMPKKMIGRNLLLISKNRIPLSTA